jgi:hypothetical protein
MEATLHRFPDFNFLQSEILPRYLSGKDWLLPLLLHAKMNTVCMDFGCTTCGAGPIKQTLRLMWQVSNEKRSIQNLRSKNSRLNLMQAKKLSVRQFSLSEIEIIIAGLSRMNIEFYSEKQTDVCNHQPGPVSTDFSLLFPEAYYSNPLMLLLTMIFHQTSDVSMKLYGDPHKFMDLKLQDAPVHTFFLMMYRHWRNKNVQKQVC